MIDVIEDRQTAELLLSPLRAQMLTLLAEPASASSLAEQLGLPRQKVNYHLHALEERGLVHFVEDRRKGNMTERLYRASAERYVITSDVVAALTPDPAESPDRASANWLLAVAVRLARDVGRLIRGARAAQRELATFAIDGEIVFRSAADRAAFAADLSRFTAELVTRYHDEFAPQGRRHRFVIALHPAVRTPAPEIDPAPQHSTTPDTTRGLDAS